MIFPFWELQRLQSVWDPAVGNELTPLKGLGSSRVTKVVGLYLMKESLVVALRTGVEYRVVR